MLPETTEWLRQSEYDIDTAEAMCRAGRYVYAAFMCQLAIEKALKGLVVEPVSYTHLDVYKRQTMIRRQLLWLKKHPASASE